MTAMKIATPAEVLRKAMGAATVTEIADHLQVTRTVISMILNGRAGITANLALRMAEAFPDTKPELWMELQNQVDLNKARATRRPRIKPFQQPVVAGKK